MSDKDVIFIIGAGRTGTSALTRVLSLSGCMLPEVVISRTDLNAKGCWEPVDAWRMNNEFLFRHGSSPGDPTLRLQEMTFDESDKEEYLGRIQAFLGKCPRGSALVIKQPSITDLMEFWVEAARRERFSVKVVIALRHPQEVFASLQRLSSTAGRRYAPSIEMANAFWLKRNLLAERCSRNFPRLVVEYPNLLENWRAQVARISTSLEVDLRPDESRVDGFLASSLRRQRFSGPVNETFAYAWVTRVYAMLSSAARDGAIDFPVLDEIYQAYRVNERAFRLAWDGFQSAFSRFDPEKFSESLKRVPVWIAGRDF